MDRPSSTASKTDLQQAHPVAPRAYHVLGIASCAGASDTTCRHGPHLLQQYLTRRPPATGELRWAAMLSDATSAGALAAVAALARQTLGHTADWAARREPFVVIGGDHSCAIGTWSGAATALRPRGRVGLIWIDAHMDGHTPESSPSGALHGMPLAVLLGWGDPALVSLAGAIPALHPRDIWLIGVRSYEAGEQQRLTAAGVRIVYMPEVKGRGIAAVIAEARADLAGRCVGYGVTLDLDAIDPVDAPGVGCPEPGGIMAEPLLAALRGVGADKRCLGLEIAEYNPRYDVGQKTAALAHDLLAVWMS